MKTPENIKRYFTLKRDRVMLDGYHNTHTGQFCHSLRVIHHLIGIRSVKLVM